MRSVCEGWGALWPRSLGIWILVMLIASESPGHTASVATVPMWGDVHTRSALPGTAPPPMGARTRGLCGQTRPTDGRIPSLGSIFFHPMSFHLSCKPAKQAATGKGTWSFPCWSTGAVVTVTVDVSPALQTVLSPCTDSHPTDRDTSFSPPACALPSEPASPDLSHQTGHFRCTGPA